MNTYRIRKLRIWVEVALTAISAVMVVLTLVAHDWIERIIGDSPDGGSGETEWALTAGALLTTLVFAAVTTLDWRRTRRLAASG
jgi:hypothetical protein